MRIATVLFTYKRSNHTEKVLKALRKNTVLPEKLYVFQDGLRLETDCPEWAQVRYLIEGIDWCNTELICSDTHKGLAKSITEGIDYAFRENDAVIVLEDDCIPQPAFISFMQQCFEKYKNEKVLSISGYSWPFVNTDEKDPIYYCGRPCSWGWGTWKDRWRKYKEDYSIIKSLKNTRRGSRELAIWGTDLEDILINNIRGFADSWYVFWTLISLRDDYLCINPSKSLINNIGFDGTGVHCAETNTFDVKLCVEKTHIKLPSEIVIKDEVKKDFSKFYGNEIVFYKSRKAQKVLVYGVGTFCKENLLKILDGEIIVAFIDSYKKDSFYAGYMLIRPEEICSFEYDEILIMVGHMSTCIEIRDLMINNYNIEAGKIVFGIEELKAVKEMQ